MTSIDQTVRTYNRNSNNPTGLTDDILGVSRILTNATIPPENFGRTSDYCINLSSGDFYGPKKGNNWGTPIFNFDTGSGGGTITDLSNIGTGAPIYKPPLNGTVAELRSLTSVGNQIDISTDSPIDGSLELSMSDAYKPVLLSGIRDNSVLAVSVGSATLNPNGLLGSPNYPRGSIFVQVGTVDRIWVCNDPDAKVWIELAGEDYGINTIQNTQNFAGQVLRNVVDGVANLRVIRNEGTSLEVNTFLDFIDIKVSDSYIPLTLDKVYNIQDNRTGVVSQPLNTDDSASGWTRGSIWVEQEISGQNKIWICNNAAIGAAEWVLYNPGSAVKQSAFFFNIPRAVTNFVDTNFNPIPIVSASVNFTGDAAWSAVSAATTVQFRRGTTTEANKKYLVNVDIIIDDFVGAATTELHNYFFRMVQTPSGSIQSGSLLSIPLNASSATSRAGSGSSSFVITSLTAGFDDYIIELRGSVAGSTAIPPNIGIESMSVTFTEL